jgi:hypothetical protein
MNVNGLVIPPLLETLIKENKWPAKGRFLIDLGPAAAHRLSERDDQLVLVPPPFHTIADEVQGGNHWWNDFLINVGEIDYSLAVIIADFGLGSDSVVILYYGHGPEPTVLYLEWPEHSTDLHAWTLTHNSFEELASDLALL